MDPTLCRRTPLRAESRKTVISSGRYYVGTLAASRLEACYMIAPPRVQQYLDAEVAHVVARIRPGDRVLDLGCGYGRVMGSLAEKADCAVGIDTSIPSLRRRIELLGGVPRAYGAAMDALHLGFRAEAFDTVVCIQNGISAFHVDQRALVEAALRVVRPGGRVLFSTYAARFWPHRLQWFERQAQAGLIGAIDSKQTGDGVIVCKDGFTATTVSPARFAELTTGLPASVAIEEVDGSSLFCELVRA